MVCPKRYPGQSHLPEKSSLSSALHEIRDSPRLQRESIFEHPASWTTDTSKQGARRLLDQGLQVFPDSIPHFLVEPSHCVLLEVRRLAMRFGGRHVAILFIDQDGVAISVDVVGDVGDTTRFLAGRQGQR